MGQVGGGCLGWSTIVYMSSGMSRGKESSNRIELSRLVQELLNFGVFGFLQLLGVGGSLDGGGVVGGAPTHVHMYAHTCMHTHANACMVNMVISCKWLPPWGNPWEFPMMSCVHVHMGGVHPLTTPTSIHIPPTPQGGPPESFKIQ